ncbi:UDP-2,4-diacetamido-2,4,6-trideoxy-beta-L-altropyranose hydrolase [Marinomonas sp. C2222]|uniref:UDP-2,4-diacetamido-2,4, 6-trideoxy-beta-L-altropyranose hydrolase n=1 Tax=Marinomonas sargassi TaxID=2984494 RepID=A0ABT2YNN5_9GAMM|nr:UDP-2,4-diacetamido-2,4,6-trideoxy-beta-L-altropyranose hydrolase [Marinomonas sargassi]MCV2401490.1 UDP-2,4-diacetamido-2,4,6-trideoxy-beta-L-altropyranose hydrolase [Marinomonas sargassi]
MRALVRADASVSIGMGHRVRCQALISALQSLCWHCQFVVHHDHRSFASSEDILIYSEQELLVLAEQADLVILDHYGYQADAITLLYKHQPNLLVLDDMNDRGEFSSRWLLNPLKEHYPPSVEFPLLGSHYALLRPTFSELTLDTSLQRDKLLVALGGTDPLCLTLPIIKSLIKADFESKDILVLVGSNAKGADAVIDFCHDQGIAFEQGIDDVTPLMKQAKMAISAAGGTLFELACCGVPTLFAQVADNQTRSLEQHVPLDWCKAVRFDLLEEQGDSEQLKVLMTLCHDMWSDKSWQERARYIARNLVDGNGANRVAQIIHDYVVKSTEPS